MNVKKKLSLFVFIRGMKHMAWCTIVVHATVYPSVVKSFFVRGKVHGIQGVRGSKFMREDLVVVLGVSSV